MKRIILAALVGMLVSGPVWAEVVLYCTDEKGAGIVWKGDRAKVEEFGANRYTVKVLSDTRRVAMRNTAPLKEKQLGATNLSCSKPWKAILPDLISCRGNGGTVNWLFSGNQYTRSYIFGQNIGGGGSTIWISYGTCTKF